MSPWEPGPVDARIDALLDFCAHLQLPYRNQFAVLCAAHLRPCVEHASTKTQAVYDDLLSGAWSLASRPEKTDTSRFQAALEELPEAGEDDSYTPEFFTMRALSALSNAFGAIAGDDEALGFAIDDVVGVAGEFNDDTWVAEVAELEKQRDAIKAGQDLALPTSDSDAMERLRADLAKEFGPAPGRSTAQ